MNFRVVRCFSHYPSWFRTTIVNLDNHLEMRTKKWNLNIGTDYKMYPRKSIQNTHLSSTDNSVCIKCYSKPATERVNE